MIEEPPIKSKARALFPNQGMHRNAEFIADLHDNAIDYLTQAPVLAMCFGVKRNTRADRLYVASRIGGPIQRGERLRSVMAAVGVPYPLRKLQPSVITPRLVDVVRPLALLDPSTLSQIIPEKPGAQRHWLAAIAAYRQRKAWRASIVGTEEFRWLAVQSASNPCRETTSEAQEIADYVHVHGSLNWSAWTWHRALGEVELWHDRLAVEKGLPGGILPSTVIDLSDWPEHSEVGGYEFFKLSTPALLMEEGRRMRHCVSSYIPDVMNGRCSVFSIRQDMRRVATLELVGKRIAQLAGFANKVAGKHVKAAAVSFIGEAA